MKVRQLIQALRKCNQDCEVYYNRWVDYLSECTIVKKEAIKLVRMCSAKNQVISSRSLRVMISEKV